MCDARSTTRLPCGVYPEFSLETKRRWKQQTDGWNVWIHRELTDFPVEESNRDSSICCEIRRGFPLNPWRALNKHTFLRLRNLPVFTFAWGGDLPLSYRWSLKGAAGRRADAHSRTLAMREARAEPGSRRGSSHRHLAHFKDAAARSPSAAGGGRADVERLIRSLGRAAGFSPDRCLSQHVTFKPFASSSEND